MNINGTRTGGTLTVALEGRMDTNTAPELEKYLGENLGGVSELILELEDLAYTSSAGLRVILSAQKKMNGAGGTMKLCHANELVMEVLDATGFLEILTVEND